MEGGQGYIILENSFDGDYTLSGGGVRHSGAEFEEYRAKQRALRPDDDAPEQIFDPRPYVPGMNPPSLIEDLTEEERKRRAQLRKAALM